ncbi:hypothetical protein [Humibacter sp.]|jgi:hypothetical protein|uniref:hypothetical protein n=1 Tax=Humibacter sp. TaxID=1940291 RepID=UPI002D168FFB|nr:hypothetical protein [Humibacter sp.]HVX06573.1 hypothetical protein [Humibacter sp.]
MLASSHIHARPVRRALLDLRPVRVIRLAFAVFRRDVNRTRSRLLLFSGWVWVAAGSLVGFEMLEILVGGLIAVPEVLPVVLIALAFAWYFRRGIRRMWWRASAWWRRRRPR